MAPAELFTALEHSAAADLLRRSTALYVAVNVAHLLGVALLFGAIVPVDLRRLRSGQAAGGTPPDRLAVGVSAAGLVLAAVSGAALILPRAVEYAGSTWFWLKLAVVAAGAVNALFARWRGLSRVAAMASLVLWSSAILLGRLLGYVSDF